MGGRSLPALLTPALACTRDTQTAALTLLLANLRALVDSTLLQGLPNCRTQLDDAIRAASKHMASAHMASAATVQGGETPGQTGSGSGFDGSLDEVDMGSTEFGSFLNSYNIVVKHIVSSTLHLSRIKHVPASCEKNVKKNGETNIPVHSVNDEKNDEDRFGHRHSDEVVDSDEVVGENVDSEAEEDWDLEEKHLIVLHQELLECLRYFDLPLLNASLQNITKLLTMQAQVTHTGNGRDSVVAKACSLLTGHLGVLLHQFVGMADYILNELVAFYRSISKLHYLLAGLFTDLLEKGFCRPAEEETQESDDHDGEEFDGTGIGEGVGSKDVSDQIENEEQILGNKGDKEDKKEDDTDIKEEDTGIEMENDFDGELYDQDPRPDDENNQGNGIIKE